MAKTKTTKKPLQAARSASRTVAVQQEADGVYILKLVLYLIVGSQWLRITKGDLTIPLPIGFIIGLLFARFESLQIDRKIEYAILLLSMFISFWLPIGLEIVI